MPEREATEPLPFEYRMTNKGAGDVLLEVGDDFDLSPAWANSENGIMSQIGLDMMSKGLQFLGHDSQSAKMICALALKSGGSGYGEWVADGS